MAKKTKTELKQIAQDALLHGVGNILGYWNPEDEAIDMTEEERDQLQDIMQREADRIAKMFGYEKAWVN